MGQAGATVRLGAVQAASVLLDRDATADRAVELIREAGRLGVDVLGFPEGFLPSHPAWYHFHPASGPRATAFATRLAENAVEVPSATTDRLCDAARESGTFVVMGCCERAPDRVGTLYNSLLFIGRDGEILGRHRKLVATLGERLVHSPGDLHGMRAYEAAGGARVGGLICGENSNPLASFLLDTEGVNVHVASWPAHFNPGGVDMRAVTLFVSQALAYQLKAFVINAVGELDDRALDELPVTDEQRQWLKATSGGASIIGPWGDILAGPMEAGEGILCAEVSIADLVAPKVTQDYAGHYNRFDLMRVQISDRGGYPGVEIVPEEDARRAAGAQPEPVAPPVRQTRGESTGQIT